MRERFLLALLLSAVRPLATQNDCEVVSAAPTPSSTNGTKPLTITALFSIYGRDEVSSKCDARSPRRFAVEQTEAFYLAATEISENATLLSLHAVVASTCGAEEGSCDTRTSVSDAINAFARDANAVVVGPLYGWSEGGDASLFSVYTRAAGKRDGGIFPLVHSPIPFVRLVDQPFLLTKVVYVSQTCRQQAEAAIDVITALQWKNVTLVTSADACGADAGDAFETSTRLSTCAVRVKYSDGTALDGFVILLTSIEMAFDVIGDYLASSGSQLGGFLLGDLWGDPLLVDSLYERIINLVRGRPSVLVIALRSRLNGFDRIQSHMASLRANSSRLTENVFLRQFWEDHFNCSIARRTCSETASLQPITRPILRNNEAVLTVDAVYVTAAYYNALLRKNPNGELHFNTGAWLFRQENVSVYSSTGNHIGLNALEGRWRQPYQWQYDVLSLYEEKSAGDGLGHSIVATWDFTFGKTTLLSRNSSSLALNVRRLCDVTSPTTSSAVTLSPSMKTRTGFCSSADLRSLVVVPIFLTLCIGILFVVCFLIKSRVRVFRFTHAIALLTACLSVVLSFLIIFDVFRAFVECHALFADFLFNSNNDIFLAAIVTEIASQAIQRRLRFRPTLFDVLFHFFIGGIGLLLSALASFTESHSNVDSFRGKSRCFDVTPLLAASYLYPLILLVLCTSAGIYFFKRKNATRLMLIIVTTESVSLVVLYVIFVGLALGINQCDTQIAAVALLALFPSLTLSCILATVVLVVYHRTQQTDLEPSDVANRMRQFSVQVCADTFWDDDVREQMNQVMIIRERVQVGLRIGKGNFGEVFKGILDGAEAIAIKSMKESLDKVEVNDFVREGLQMRLFDHPHVMKIHGICMSRNCDGGGGDGGDGVCHSPLLVLPFMENGDLKNYLRQRRSKLPSNEDENKVPRVSLEQKVKFCSQIASGMDYISTKGFIHRDLAARNCMVDVDLNIKVADFGLARGLKGKDYYRMGAGGELPIRWMAFESLFDMIFTTKSDVWSYGVTVWEIMSLARVPYIGMSNNEVLRSLKQGRRLTRPDDCPEELFSLMRRCWKLDSAKRPTFADIVVFTDGYRADLKQFTL